MIHVGSLCIIRNIQNPACSHLAGRVCEIVGPGTMGFKWSARIAGYQRMIVGEDRHFLPIDSPDEPVVITRELRDFCTSDQ